MKIGGEHLCDTLEMGSDIQERSQQVFFYRDGGEIVRTRFGERKERSSEDSLPTFLEGVS